MQVRDAFGSRLGFVLASAGATVGLGNVWGFPMQAANHGGGAFLLVYILVLFVLALPALYTELAIGHKAQSNPVDALTRACDTINPGIGACAGFIGLLGAIVMLSFYAIVAGWVIAHAIAPISQLTDQPATTAFLTDFSTERSLLFTFVIVTLTAGIIVRGVKSGIEAWSRMLMPALLVLMLGLIGFIAMQPGAMQGFKAYLIPDFSKVLDPNLILAAMGQAFFSLSVGVGCMMIYGSYLSPKENLPKLTLSVAAIDSGIAFLAGLLIVPAAYLAINMGVEASESGELIGGSQLMFTVLPELFVKMGSLGLWVGLAFFVLMSIASLTSTISTMEIPVAFLNERYGIKRLKATVMVCISVMTGASLIIFNFDWLFDLVITGFTQYLLPLMGLFYFLVIGWIWQEGNALRNAKSTFGKVLFQYIRFVCPVLMLVIFMREIS